MSDQHQVYDWRFGQLCAIGYSLEMAELLAHTRIDLTTVRLLRAQGCPLELVARILAGTTALGDDDIEPFCENDLEDIPEESPTPT